MTTLAAPFIGNGVVSAWEAEYPSATFSGIVGDVAHQKTGGYHISIEDQSSTNYSVVRPDDKAPPGTWSRKHATALDMSMSKADMIKSTRRWMVVWSDRTDPRRKYFNAFNGWTGSGNAQRWDFVTNTVQTSTNDHQWHQHTEKRRRYWNDPVADRAMISIARGETKEQWLASEAGGGDEMWTQKGQQGNDVGDLQDRLIEVGIPVGPDGEPIDPNDPYKRSDKDYGSWTSRAVASLHAVPGDNGEVFGSEQNRALRALERKRDAGNGGGGGLPAHTHEVPGMTFSGAVTGTTPAVKTGAPIAL